MKKVLNIFLMLLFFAHCMYGQEERTDNFIAFGASYGVDMPFADLADRFGTSFHAGISLDLFQNKFNGIFSLEGAIIFGENVEEDVLSTLRLNNGAILGADGAYADVFLRERGSYLGISMDKIIIPSKNNSHAGLALGFGVGVLQHKVKLQVESGNTPQFAGDYEKGYDRNSMGLALKQKIGYLNIGKRKSVNYEIALTVSEGFTKQTRSINFDTGQADNKSRFDVLIGIDFKWFIPFNNHSGGGDEEYFY